MSSGSTTIKVFRRYELAYTTSPATKRSLLSQVSICDGPPGDSSTAAETTLGA